MYFHVFPQLDLDRLAMPPPAAAPPRTPSGGPKAKRRLEMMDVVEAAEADDDSRINKTADHDLNPQVVLRRLPKSVVLKQGSDSEIEISALVMDGTKDENEKEEEKAETAAAVVPDEAHPPPLEKGESDESVAKDSKIDDDDESKPEVEENVGESYTKLFDK